MMETVLFSFAEIKMAQNPAYRPAVYKRLFEKPVSCILLLSKNQNLTIV
jgi:hypothetical protein